MATVIDSLLIELGLDTSKFDSSSKKSVEELRKFQQQAEKSFKASQKGSKELGDGFDKARNALISLGVSLVGIQGFTSFAKNMTATNAGISRTAELFKMSARELDTWGGVLKSVGGDASDFQSSTQAIQQSLSNMQFGDTSLLESLGKLQVLGSDALSALDINKKELDIYKLADAFKQLSDAGKEQDAYVQAQAMGINRNYFMVLKQGSEAVHKLYDENYKLSGVNAENTKKAEDLQKAWGKVGQAFSGASNQIMDQLYPSLNRLAEATESGLVKFVDWDKKLQGGLSNAIIGTGAIATLAGAFKFLGVSLEAQIATVAKWGSTIEGIVTSGWFMRFMGALGLATYSEGLNKGEDEQIRKIHEAQDKKEGVTRDAKGNVVTKDGKPVAGDFSELEKKYGLPVGMLDKVWQIESNRGQNMGPSSAGATGHFQFMPKTAAAYGLSKEDTYDLGKSSDAAARMLGDLLKQFKGDEFKAIAAYNWGSGNLTNKGMANIPPETQAYLNKYNSGFMGANVAANANQSSTNNTSSVNIQNVNVETQATDANGIAQSMKIAIENNSLINLGMVGNR